MKPLTLVLAVTTLTSILALAWALGRPAPDEQSVAKLRADLEEARELITQLRRDLANKPVSSASLPSTGSSVASAASGLPLVDPAATASASTPAGTGAALREMIKNPAMRDLLGQQQAVQIETGYARLFEHLQLTPEEKAHFKKLLTERAKIEADLGLHLLDSNLTPQQRQKLIADAEKNKTAFDETIRQFLNDSTDWNTFQTYEATRPERLQYETMGRSIFSANGEPLNAQQEDKLIQLMAQLRQNPSAEQAALMKNMTNPAQMNEANLQTYLEYQRAANARALEQAATFLSPVQVKALQSYQEQSLALIRNGYEMGRMLTGGR